MFEIRRVGFWWYVIKGEYYYGKFAMYRNAWRLKKKLEEMGVE